MSFENYNEDGAICPHCGHLNKADSDSYELFKESTCHWSCGDCDEVFNVEVHIDYSWTTAPAPEAGK